MLQLFSWNVAMKYAKEYWAKHLILSSSANSDLWHDLECLLASFASLALDPADALIVAKWLKVRYWII